MDLFKSVFIQAPLQPTILEPGAGASAFMDRSAAEMASRLLASKPADAAMPAPTSTKPVPPAPKLAASPPKRAAAVANPGTRGVTPLPGIPQHEQLPVQDTDPTAAESSDCPQYSVSSHQDDLFDLGADPWAVLSNIEHNVPLADWRHIMAPRVMDPVHKITLDMLVRAFAEYPRSSLTSHDRGARFTAHQVCLLTSKNRELTEDVRHIKVQLDCAHAHLRWLEQDMKQNKAVTVSSLQQFNRKIQDLEHKFARHLSSQQDARQAQLQAQIEAMDTQPEQEHSAEQAGDDAWTPAATAEAQVPQQAPTLAEWGDDEKEEGQGQVQQEAEEAPANGPQPITPEMIAKALLLVQERSRHPLQGPAKKARTGVFTEATELPKETYARKCSTCIQAFVVAEATAIFITSGSPISSIYVEFWIHLTLQTACPARRQTRSTS